MFEEVQYLNLLAPKLERFTKKKKNLWNFRCPICHDSQYDKRKARAYVIDKKGKLFFYCHNCQRSMKFPDFLKTMDEELFSKYLLEKFGNSSRQTEVEYEYNVSEKIQRISNIHYYLSFLEGPISELSENHRAKEFVHFRQIPQSYWNSLYFTSNYKRFINNFASEKFYNENDGARIVIPFFDEENNLIAFQGRGLDDQPVKYLTYKFDEDNPKIFGLNTVDKTKRVYIVEGPIDSMFLPNSVAAAGADLNNLNFSDAVYVFDNEPRNRQIVKQMNKMIEQGEKVFIPPNWLKEKDINDWAKTLGENNLTKIKETIDNYTFSGMRAKLQLTEWKRI